MTTETVRSPTDIGRARGLLAPAFATLLMTAFLIGLGVWQIQRLAWKEGLIREIDERTTAAPVPLPPRSAWAELRPDDYAYRHVSATGTFEHGAEIHVFRPLGESRGPAHGIGDLVLTPLRLDGGGTVIVNRGFVPIETLDPAMRPDGQVQGRVAITGLMREPEPRNLFTPNDDPVHNQWFTRDPVAMAAFLHLDDAAPFTIDQDVSPIPGGLPQGGETVLDIPNNHLSYALTWFGLAAGLLGVFAVFAWRRLRGIG